MPERGTTPLDLFWKLSGSSDGVRTEAAMKLVVHLKNKDSDESEDQVKTNANYCLHRLVSGLASERVTSRKGFFVCLVEVLRQCPHLVSVQDVLQTIDQALNVKGTKTEEGEYLSGKMLAYGALLRSGQVNVMEMADIFSHLLDLPKKRNYLSVPIHTFLVDAIKSVDDQDAFAKHIWPVLEEKCSWTGDDAKAESLWLLMQVQDKFVSIPSEVFIKERFDSKILLHKNLATNIAKSLLNGTTTLAALKQGPVLGALLEQLAKSPTVLNHFWYDNIEPQVSPKGSVYKNRLAFTILSQIVPLLKEDKKALLTSNIIGTATTLLSRLESTPEEDALIVGALEKLVEAAKEDVSLQIPLLKSLLTSSGSVAFDKVTGTHLVQSLLVFSGLDTVKAASGIYMKAVIGVRPDGSAYSVQERIYSAQQLAKLVGHPAMASEATWKAEMLAFLLTVTQFEVKQPVELVPSVPLSLSREAKLEIKETFFRSLDTKAKSLEQVCGILVKTLDVANRLMGSKKSVVVPLRPFDQASTKAWKNMVHAVEGMKDGKEDRVFQLLFIHVGFQLMSGGEDNKATIELLEELHLCYEKSKKTKRRSKSKGQDEEPHWVEVVVDLLLSLLSQNKNVLRRVVGSVTTLLCPHMTLKALHSIVDVVNPPNDDEEEEEKDEDDDEDDEFEDIEEDIKEEVESDDENVNDSSDEEEEEEEEEEGKEGEENAELKKRLKDAMGDGAAESDAESIDMDDLDDEDMMRLDSAIAQVFRQMSGKKSKAQQRKEKKDAMAQMHFKIRALDMIDVYLSHQPLASHVIHLSVPIISALEKANKDQAQLPLQTRLKGTLRKLTNFKKLQIDPDLKAEDLLGLLKALVELANSGSPLVVGLSQPMSLFSQLSTLALKCSQQMDDEHLHKKVVQVYLDALEDFFQKNNCILPVAFFAMPMQINWQGALALLEKLTEHGFSADTRMYRRTQALGLISALFHNQSLKSQVLPKTLNIIFSKVESAFDTYIQEAESMKHRFICELLNLTQGLFQTVGMDGHNWDKIKELMQSLRAKIPHNRNFSDVKKAFNKVSVLLKINVVKGSEKKAKNAEKVGANKEEGTNGMDAMFDNHQKQGQNDGEDKKKNKKKNKKKKKKHTSNEVQLKRKERKKFELEDQYKDVDLPSFKGALQDTLNMDEDTTSTVVKVKTENKKRKVEPPSDKEVTKKKKKKNSKI